MECPGRTGPRPGQESQKIPEYSTYLGSCCRYLWCGCKFKNVLYSNDLKESCFKSDLIIIHTEWDEFKSIDFKKISKNKNLKIYDLRNLYSPEKMKKLGLIYYSIGR